MSAALQTAEAGTSLVARFASRYGVEPNKLMTTLKATAFKVKDGEATNEQMMALLIVADQYGLNPFTKEIYAFPDKKNGIVPVVGVDGWSRIINENPAFDGMDFNESQETATPDGGKECPRWIECVIHRKDRSHPIRTKEYLDEVYRPAFRGQNGPVVGPWQTHTKRFLRHKSMIQCARIAFGFAGIFDQDEAERIIEGETFREESTRPDIEVAKEQFADAITAIKDGIKEGNLVAASKVWNELSNDTQMRLWVAPTKGGPFSAEEREVIHSSQFAQAYFGGKDQ